MLHLDDHTRPATRADVDGDRTEVLIEADGTALGDAVVQVDPDAVRISFTMLAGRVPSGVRRELVEAVFALPQLHKRSTVRAALPLGDVELLAGLRAHLADVRTRAAGSTCLVEARTLALSGV